MEQVRVNAAPAPEVLFDNGPVVTSLGTGAGGADESVLSSPLLTYGYGIDRLKEQSVADDFTIEGVWAVDSVKFYAYQTGSGTVPSITAGYVRIWDGNPSLPGSSVVWGDFVVNRLVKVYFANIYRVPAYDSGSSSRPVMSVVCATTGLTLPAGTYWVEFSATGASSYVGPWMPPVTVAGQPSTGNGLQYTNAEWNLLADGGTGAQQGAPFVLLGDLGITVPNDAGQCGAVVNYEVPLTEDDLAVEKQLSGLAPGAEFPVGITVNTFQIVRNDGEYDTARVVINVEDVEPPVLVCQDFAVVPNEKDSAFVDLSDVLVSNSDNCGIASFTTEPDIKGGFTVGSTLVTLAATDISGNVSTCSFTVTVEDVEAPVLQCSPLTIVLTEEGKYTLNQEDYLVLTAGTTDNYTPYEDLVFSFSPLSFDCLQVSAPVELTISATDASGNVSVCTTLVTVEDHTLPVAQCQDVDVYLDINGEAFVFPGHLSADNGGVGVPGWAQYFNDMESGSYDACGIARMSIDRQLFGCDDVGAHTVTLTVEDPSGNQATCQATVMVHDTIAPVVSPVSDVTVEVAPGVCQTTVDYPQLTASDACPVSRELVSGLGSEGLFPVGTTTETWQFTDGGGNVVVVSFAVNVVAANSAPTLDAISDVTVDEDPLEVLIPLTGIGYGSDCASQALTITATAPANPVIQTMEVIYTPGEMSGWLRITINPEQSGTADITVQVSDNGAGTTDGALHVEQHFTLTIRPVNDPPVLLHPVADQVVHASYQLVLPLSSQNGELFADADAGDQLTLTVGLEGNQPLPSWLTFANDTLRAAPMLQDTGCVTVVVRATDLSGAFVEDQFRLCVDGYPVGIGDIEKSSPTVRLYPNPTTGQVRVDLGVRMIKPVGVTVYNLTGREVFRRDYFSGEELTFDMSPYVTGLYLVKITVDGIPT
ncbi:MAG TPA: HYR domain-containing protein, partial [Prolixibacteraceae bacterium]|nr:HYR domain-containing protein [Prolixibacteraceae bacterium]